MASFAGCHSCQDIGLGFTCKSTVYSLSGDFSAGCRAGHVVVYVRRDEVGGVLQLQASVVMWSSVVPTVDLVDSVPEGVAGCHSRLCVRGGAALPRCRLGPTEVRLRR